jgi:Na+-transporting methylmalonyl-CoA/oxaloacetate decarboxylase gamma subunit
MEIDWGQALQIGGIGFLLVFAVLAILALATGIVGRIVDRTGSSSDAAEKSGNNSGK